MVLPFCAAAPSAQINTKKAAAKAFCMFGNALFTSVANFTSFRNDRKPLGSSFSSFLAERKLQTVLAAPHPEIVWRVFIEKLLRREGKHAPSSSCPCNYPAINFVYSDPARVRALVFFSLDSTCLTIIIMAVSSSQLSLIQRI